MIDEIKLIAKQSNFHVSLIDRSITCTICNSRFTVGDKRDKKREKAWYKDHAIKCSKLTLGELQFLGLITYKQAMKEKESTLK